MIRNLSQSAFQDFGTVQTERIQNGKHTDKRVSETWELTPGITQIHRARSRTQIRCDGGMCVLCVSLDGEKFQRFYLDKTAGIHKNVFFALLPITEKASLQLFFQEAPEKTGKQLESTLRVEQKTRVEGIYTFFYQQKEKGFLFPGEAHPMAELTYVDQGTLHSVADGQDLLLGQGEMVIYGPGQWHMQYADIGMAPRFVTVFFDFSGADVTPLLNRKFSAPQSAVTLLQQMLQEQENGDDFSNDIILTQLNLLLLMLLRETASAREEKLRAANGIHNENEIIRRAQQYVSAHIREKLSVPLVARYADVSPSYLTALFHKNLQISPGEYIRRSKLQESKRMIREGNMNFTEIAAALQYSTVYHFSRQFKEKFGTTPTEYAKSVR